MPAKRMVRVLVTWLRAPVERIIVKIQSANRSRVFPRSGFSRIGWGLVCAVLILTGTTVIAQTEHGTPTVPSPIESTTPEQTSSNQAGPRQVVKIVVEPGTNRILLIGSEADIAIVLRTLTSIQERLNSMADPTVTEKVVLKSQLADTVVSIMSNSIDVHARGRPAIKINAVHFPEAVLLSGPASAVERAKQLLATIDRYKDPATFDPPAQKQID